MSICSRVNRLNAMSPFAPGNAAFADGAARSEAVRRSPVQTFDAVRFTGWTSVRAERER
jgi:hypothetical protein